MEYYYLPVYFSIQQLYSSANIVASHLLFFYVFHTSLLFFTLQKNVPHIQVLYSLPHAHMKVLTVLLLKMLVLDLFQSRY